LLGKDEDIPAEANGGSVASPLSIIARRRIHCSKTLFFFGNSISISHFIPMLTAKFTLQEKNVSSLQEI